MAGLTTSTTWPAMVGIKKGIMWPHHLTDSYSEIVHTKVPLAHSPSCRPSVMSLLCAKRFIIFRPTLPGHSSFISCTSSHRNSFSTVSVPLVTTMIRLMVLLLLVVALLLTLCCALGIVRDDSWRECKEEEQLLCVSVSVPVSQFYVGLRVPEGQLGMRDV